MMGDARRLGLAALALLAVLALSACEREPRRHVVEIGAMAYEPAALEVATGDTVTWTNGDIVPHTVTFADGESTADHLDRGETLEIVAREPGTVQYRCRYHPSMVATLTVR
jgi:plastocyanin